MRVKLDLRQLRHQGQPLLLEILLFLDAGKQPPLVGHGCVQGHEEPSTDSP
jgi:hypothetical protein